MKHSELKQIIKEEINKVLKENTTPKHKIVSQWMGPDFFLSKKKEENWDDKDYELFYRLEKMVTTTGKVPKLKENTTNYVFFQNLKTIKMMVDKLLTMDKNAVDAILLSGHDWAEDHIATSKDDVEEVYNFLVNHQMSNLTEKLKFTKEFDNDPKLKGKQKNLPDNLQQKIINKK